MKFNSNNPKNLTLQPIPYQGSKRRIANQIMIHAVKQIDRLIEPFAGSSAISLYCAFHKKAKRYVLNDSYPTLMSLWKMILSDPETCSQKYERMWTQQLGRPEEYYYEIRDEFNRDQDPIKLLFLLAKCAKNAVRFNSKGGFNQSPDKRRLGRKPKTMRAQLIITSNLLKTKTEIRNEDFTKTLSLATTADLVYMDPPYQGVSNGKDPRYHQGLDREKLVVAIEKLINRDVPFLLSLDGRCGNKTYGQDLPKHLGLKKVDIHAGRSAQATLNGNSHITTESLYISPNLFT